MHTPEPVSRRKTATRPQKPVIAFVLLTVASVAGTSQSSDAPGTRDHPLIKRYEGSTIMQAVPNAYDEYVVPLGPVRKGRDASLTKSARIEGGVTRVTYSIPPGRSTLEVMRNYESELKGAGFAVLYQASGEALGFNPYMRVEFADAAGYKAIGLPGSPNWSLANVVGSDQRFLAARLARPQGDVHVVLYATTLADTFQTKVYADPARRVYMVPGQVLLQLDVIEAKPMDAKMVTVSASDMAAGIANSGSIALYGILFDSNSADVTPASAPTLSEIAALLNAQPTLKLLVVGHTDNVGTFDFNRDLSQRRAAAVVKTLTASHGIDARRLTPVGVSFASPVASNKTEEGRAQNRRVQLVEQ